MNRSILSLSLFFFAGSLYAQDFIRIQVSGKLFAANDLEGVTIFNTSSKEGTIADFQGNFTLEVALNDVLEISALQYEANTIRVNQEVITTKQIRLFLVDKVNALNEVLLLPSQLSGNLLVDMQNAKGAKKMEMNFGNLKEIEFSEDAFTKVDNKIVKKDQLADGLNVANIFGLNKLINRPLKKRSLPKEDISLDKILATRYKSEFYEQNYKIPSPRVEAFIRFVVLNGLTENLLQEKEEFFLLDFFQKKSVEFLKQEYEKN